MLISLNRLRDQALQASQEGPQEQHSQKEPRYVSTYFTIPNDHSHIFQVAPSLVLLAAPALVQLLAIASILK